MKSRVRNNWRQPPVPKGAVPTDIVVETIADITMALGGREPGQPLRFWSPPAGAVIHGVLWFVSLQRMAHRQFPDAPPTLVLDCADRGDLAHAALREGMLAICFRGNSSILEKLQTIANTVGAIIETHHPSL